MRPYRRNCTNIRRTSDEFGDDEFGDDEFRDGFHDHCVTSPGWNVEVRDGEVDLYIGVLCSILNELSRSPQLPYKVGRREQGKIPQPAFFYARWPFDSFLPPAVRQLDFQLGKVGRRRPCPGCWG